MGDEFGYSAGVLISSSCIFVFAVIFGPVTAIHVAVFISAYLLAMLVDRAIQLIA